MSKSTTTSLPASSSPTVAIASSSSIHTPKKPSTFAFPVPPSPCSAARCLGITTAQHLTSKRTSGESTASSTIKNDRWWITQRFNLYIIPPCTTSAPLNQLLSEEIDCLRFAGTATESIIKGLHESNIYRMAMEVLKKHTTYPKARARRTLAPNLMQYIYMLGCAHLHRSNSDTALFTTRSGVNTVCHFLASADPSGVVNVYHWSGKVTVSEIPPELRQGKGTFTLVQKIQNIATGSKEALKTWIPSSRDPNKVLSQLREDISRLRIVHEYAVNRGLPTHALPKLPNAILGIIPPHNVTAYVEELYEGGDLQNLHYPSLSVDQALDLVAKLATILEALDIFHQAEVIHADVKLENVLFRFGPDGLFDLSLTDIGLCYTLSELVNMNAETKPEFYSPEYRLTHDLQMLQEHIKARRTPESVFLAHKMEVYAAGKTLDLVCKHAPLPEPLLQRLTAITRQMLDRNPANRPTLAEARERWLAALAS